MMQQELERQLRLTKQYLLPQYLLKGRVNMSDTFSDPTPFEIRVDLQGLMHQLTRTLYTEPDIVVREMIQNAYDSILRRTVLQSDPPAGVIRIHTNHMSRTVTIADNGSGSTERQIHKYFATIGYTSTPEVRERLIQMGRSAELELATRFGIGLLAAFIIADEIEIETLSVEPDNLAWHWACGMQGAYKLQQSTRQEVGTTITLHISTACQSMLDPAEWRRAIRKCADFLPIPIRLNDEETPANTIDAPWHLRFATESERLSSYWLFVNRRFLDHPLEVIPVELRAPHKVDGVLYISSQSISEPNGVGTVDIYQNRRFITNSNSKLLPSWANFIRGIIDCPDLQPTVDRQGIISNPTVFEIRETLSDLIVQHLKKTIDNTNMIIQRLPNEIQHFFASSGLTVRVMDKQTKRTEHNTTQETQGNKEKVEAIHEMEKSLTVQRPRSIFYCYAHEDRALRNELEKHLSSLERLGWIMSWHDGEIIPGTVWGEEITRQLETAHIILLLVSPDFIHSDYCYSKEMTLAIERHYAKKAVVIPIILRPTLWENAPFASLQVLPSEGKAVSLWTNLDEAFLNIAQGIYRVVGSF